MTCQSFFGTLLPICGAHTWRKGSWALLKLMLTICLLRYTIVWPTFINHFNDLCRWKNWLMRYVWTGDGKRTPVSHTIWVRVNVDRTQDTFQGRQVCMLLLYFAYTPPQSALQHRAADGQRVAAKLQPRSAGGRNKEILVPEKRELVVIMGHNFTGPSGLINKFHGFVEVELEGRDRYVVEVESIEGRVQLVEVN